MALLQTTTLPDRNRTAPRAIVRLGALATGVIVVNLFASQVLAGLMAQTLRMGTIEAGMVSTLTLLGYALGLFMLVPLADVLENKRLIVGTLFCNTVAAICMALAPTAELLLAASFFLGASCSAIQMLVPLIASMTHPGDRGRVIGDVMGGLMVGILLSRPVASVTADIWGWRGFYVSSAAAIIILAGALVRQLPSLRPPIRMSYAQLLGSFGTLWREEHVLRVRSWTAALVMASFSAFWAAVALRLSIPPFNLTPSGIAIFALVGAAGAAATPLAGRLGDRGHVRITLFASHVAIIWSAIVSAWAGHIGSQYWALGGLGVGAILLDLGVTGDQTLGRRAVNLLQPEARGRINGLFVCLFFIGGAIGAAAATLAWTHGGWTWVCAVVGSFALLALITDMVTTTGTA